MIFYLTILVGIALYVVTIGLLTDKKGNSNYLILGCLFMGLLLYGIIAMCAR